MRQERGFLRFIDDLNEDTWIRTPYSLNRIASREAGLSVLGLGYVGLPLAVEFGKAGFHVIGVDVDQRKVDALKRRTLLHP